MSTMIATKRMALEVAEWVFNQVAVQSTEYKEWGGKLAPGSETLLHTADIDRKLADVGLDGQHWTPFVVSELAFDGVFVAANGRICTPIATIWS